MKVGVMEELKRQWDRSRAAVRESVLAEVRIAMEAEVDGGERR
jgi:hypothetical protein